VQVVERYTSRGLEISVAQKWHTYMPSTIYQGKNRGKGAAIPGRGRLSAPAPAVTMEAMYTPRACSQKGCGRPALSGAPSCIVHLPDAAAHVASLFTPGEGLALRDLDLPGILVEDADLARAEISGCRFTAATFRRVSFRGAQVSLSFLDRATFDHCDFSGASLLNVVMAGSQLVECSFVDSEVVQVNFLGISAARTVFDHSNLYGSRFIGSLLDGVSMKDCNCTRTFFDEAHKGVVDFRSSNVNEAFFQGPA
jgi:hypothetical protein